MILQSVTKDSARRVDRPMSVAVTAPPNIATEPERPSISLGACLPAVALAVILQASLLASGRSLDGHEVLVAQTAREMIQSGDGWIPTFAGEPRLQKPPLAYWLSAASYLLLGSESPLAARLPSALASVLLTILVTVLASQRFGPSAGRRAGIVQATACWSLVYGSSATVDMTLSLVVAVAIAAGMNQSTIPRRVRVLIIWGCVGLAILAKGPIGPAIILAVQAISRGTGDSGRIPRRLIDHLLGVAIASALVIPWAWMVWARHPEVLSIWFEQSAGRFLEHWGPQSRPWYYYLYKTPVLMLPWTPIVVVGVWCAVRSWFQDRRTRDLVIWFVVTLVILSGSEGKREHYLLPGLAPLAILAAIGWEWFDRRGPTWSRIVAPFLLASVLLGGFAWSAYERFLHRDEMEVVATMIDRQRSLIQSATLVAQTGSNDHSTAWLVQRPMRWIQDHGEIGPLFESNPRLLILSEGVGNPAPGWRVVDQVVWSRPDWLGPKSKTWRLLQAHGAND